MLNFRGDFSWFLLQVDRDVGLPKHFHPFPKYEWVKSLLPCLCMSMSSYNHCHGVCSCETHTLSSCIRTAVGRSSSNKTWIPWTRWWNHVVCPLSCECLGACFFLFLFLGEGKDEWKQHGWQGFLSRTLAWPSCAIDIETSIDSTMFDGDCFMVCRFFRASDHQQFQEQDVETHSATFRSKCGDTCTNAWSPKAKQHRSFGGYQGFPAWDFLLRRHEKCLDATKKTSSSLIGYVGKNPGSNSLKQAAYFLGWRFFRKSEYQIGLGILYPPKHQKRVDHDWLIIFWKACNKSLDLKLLRRIFCGIPSPRAYREKLHAAACAKNISPGPGMGFAFEKGGQFYKGILELAPLRTPDPYLANG